ncbi:MAG TPA: TIGR03086 family metal-binding protein [Acidimicrobiales bacterium]|nr:TIGR03086 family metal-binding protein [Acidimicrobiales bacterium]
MNWTSLDTYREGLDFFTAVVDAVPAGSWERPSPCDGWQALDVLGHVGETTGMGARILRGGDLAFSATEPPSSAVIGDPAAWWRALVDDARSALTSVDDLDREIDSPVGPRTIREGFAFPAVDLFVHGWDLAAATGQSVIIPDEAIAFTRDMFENIPTEISRRPGVFAPELDAPAGASTTGALIAFTGRDPDFIPTA